MPGRRALRDGRWSSRSTTRAAGAATTARIGARSPIRAASFSGPRLANAVAACTASDGSHWAVQRMPQPTSPNTWLGVAHWTGPVAKVETGMAWAYDGRFQVIFGRVTYAGQPVYGFGTTRLGAPTDAFRRLVYLDTFNSAPGRDWTRENSFVTHKRTGAFCYGLYPSGGGPGSKYRLSVSGPGVTPVVTATVRRWHAFDPASSADAARQERAADRLFRSWGVSEQDKDCGPILAYGLEAQRPLARNLWTSAGERRWTTSAR